MAFRAHILGAAAGGGLPQWNCGCDNCNLARSGTIPPQTQSSLAVTADGTSWAILNASPDIRGQLADTPALHPTGLRDLPLRAVLVTNGDIDHVAGLLTLREMQPFRLFATAGIHEVLAENPIFNAVNATVVPRETIALDAPFELVPGLIATLFPVPGKVPLYLEGETVETDLIGDQTVGVRLQALDSTAYYIPGCALLTDDLRARLDGADTLFFDGTLWADDEMVRAGLGKKTGKRMGHMSMSGPDGSIAAFEGLSIRQKIYVHMNNTNPVLRPSSAEKAQAEAAGWIIGQDGMEVS
ncbi:coenzyme PQQ biosynthesis protein B [Dinoroseobacter shibae DFL 12 = DSM 16493]|jgi:pyrroloquinoline quinone biosynthesis protein B|uniref:Coenzyme PQQ synthesis protein B n=1 Tax=Dinoroseobacter shibae (strain DSM 16493 / NCIMB 14021 / DFL 12) TaxID=398580 RepID=A8LN55_DINSH|nr:pyrroloquinoline quinone biosynthesis protein PqqB [Dinoroseobacter shibae]ABV92199.1 coenzyme PQQ biosynthesis protein B [Dinoroseobacter shibae DFL 12 = DSM 16493]URF47153.1 pyrroloquinoline quinone biosynthesis protein PqqB [Dinoroseobacter shibae]URF51464.1 pyrroloquinoline quinone biosynthesis protein PqqB [Dinoroseobacter shibae]